jgi:Domain of Unknown Function with PDB structure (DUF3861)
MTAMKQHRYRITIDHLALPDGSTPPAAAALVLEVGNHDELSSIVSRARQRGDLPPDEAAAFAVGLKLFSEVMLQHRDLPLFADFAPHFKAFMQRVKQRPASAGASASVQT